MFETLVTGLLTSALGSYIEPKCFSSDKINVAVWSGYVVLTELEVKPEVVAELPAVKLVRGLVGSIELKIPWNRLQSDSVVATVDDVYLLLRTEEDIDAVMRQMDEFTLKKKLLEELYAQAKRQEDTADATSSEDGFAARLVNKIIDNLELHIRRIHIRVEDHSTGDHPFAMGLTIESVHVQSTNSNWQPSYVDTSKSNEPRIFKIVELNHLSVYCNPDCELQRDRQVDFETCSAEEFSSAFSRSIPKRFDDRHYHHMQLYPSQQQHHFLLKPIDASARLIVNRDVFDANVPKFEIDVNVSEVAFRLEESQYCDILYLASALQIPDHYTKYQRYRKFRPQAAVFDEPMEWWKYAITSVIEDLKTKKQQWTWGFMKDRREDRKRYVGLWQQKSRQLLELADIDYLVSDSEDNDDDSESGDTTEDKDRRMGSSPLDLPKLSSFELDSGLEEIERRRSVEDVLFFRYIADLEVRKFQASQATRVRRRLPTPPTHKSQAFSDTESVDTEFTESSVPAEVRYRSWGAWMFGWTSKLATPSADGESGQTPHRIIPEVELRELFKILEEPSRRSKKRLHKHRDVSGHDDASDCESQMELSELYRVTVTLQRGSLTLASDPETNKTLLRDDPSYGRKYAPTEFLLGTFSQLQVAAVARDETVVVDVSLQSIEAFDESAESSAFSRLLSRKQIIHPTVDGDDVNVNKLSGVVFLMSYEMSPANSSADASLFVHMEPLEIVLSPTARCWGRLAKFMDTPASLGLWEELEVASFNDIVNLKARTDAKLDYVMENRIALAVDLRIQAPVIIVPESDTDYNCARLVVDLGRINFRTDRLSQMDSERMNMSSTGGPPSSRSTPGSLALLSPSHFRGVDPNTSFVQQLYDEAEKGEGAIRWKEEFYDKFSLSVANIHVLLIPYGKTSRVQDDGTGDNGMNYPSVSLPPYLTDIYNEEQEYELVERFNINVTIRMSILPLDATLTRFYVHADLPALTFNLSLEKYFQLMALADRSSLANTEAPKTSRKYSNGDFYSTEDAYGNAGIPNSDDKYEAMRRGSFLSTSALKKFMLNDNGSAPPSATGVLADDAGDSDENSSVESDDTWFSITSGNLDQSAAELERNLSISDLTDTVMSEDSISGSTPPRSERKTRKRPRPYTPGRTTKLLDRRLMVCSFTVPLISMQLKKPNSSVVPSYASYRYDTSEFDDDPADNGTILVKLQGSRVRVGQKTLSTQVNVSLMSLEVEDFLDASGRSTQYLLFSCPTITAPFSVKAPLRRGGKFSGYSTQRRRPARQRERVISFHPNSSDGSRSKAFAAPETLLELGYSSLNDQRSGKEVLRDVDLQLGSVQFNFDQSYVCSLLELFEESSLQLALVPVYSRGIGGGDISISDADDILPPPFELTPTIKQEYSMPVSLTESVRADLERARKNLFEQASDASKNPTITGVNDPVPVALKLGVRLHSVSVCFSDRGESVASVAILDSQVQVGAGKEGQINVSGLVGDVKVFDLSSKKRQEDGLGISGAGVRGFENPSCDYVEIFGLDTSATFATDEMKHILSIECLISTEMELKSISTAEDEEQAQEQYKKSNLSLSVQPVRLLAQPEFVENLANYVVDGPLQTHFLSKRTASSDAVMESEHKRTSSLVSEFQLPPRFSPMADRRPEILTPFFDAVDTSNRGARQFHVEEPSPPVSQCEDNGDNDTFDKQSEDGDNSATGNDTALILAQILDNFNLDIKFFHPCVVLPSTPLKDIRVSLQSQPVRGIVLDFGTISVALRQEGVETSRGAPAFEPFQTTVAVEGLQITSLADQTAILDRSGFQVRCSMFTQTMNKELGDGGNTDISLDVEIYPVCINVSETNVCLALEVFYEAIIPIFDTVQGVIHQNESSEGASVVDSASLRSQLADDGDLKSALPTPNKYSANWGQLTVQFLLEEFKIAMISYSEAPHQFETWMKSVIDIPDEISSRESSGGTSYATQGRSYPQHFMGRRGSFPNEIPCCVIGEISFVALEASVALSLKESPLVDSQAHLECDFSLQEAVICDKIADSTEFLTHLFGPVPGALLERMESRISIASDSSSFSFLSRDDITPPLLRPSMSQSRLDVSSSQLSGRMMSRRDDSNDNGPGVTTNSLDLSLSSARFILLPRTLLRLEHFVLDVFLAASKKRSELELQRDEAMDNNPPGVESSAFIDADTDDNRGERQETRFTVPPLRPRNDSISESLKDDLNAVRSAFMSPLQRMLSSTSAKEGRGPGSFTSRMIAEETGSGTSVVSNTKGPGKPDNRKRLVIPQWKIDARFSNLQMWVVSTDRKTDVTGCVLSSELVAKFDSTLDQAEVSPDSSELVTASVILSKVEVLVGSPRVSERCDNEHLKPTHHTGTLVENFDVHVKFALRQCFRPVLEETIDPESSDGKSDENSDSNCGGTESGDNLAENSDDETKGPWIATSPIDKTDNTATNLPELFLRAVPSEWQEWILSEPTARINQVYSHVAYRDLPLLLKISSSLTSMFGAEKKIRSTFIARLQAAADDLDWSDLPDAAGDYSEYAHYFGGDDVGDNAEAEQDALSAPQHNVLTCASLVASGIQFRLIDNIVDQASPVVEFDSKAIEVLLRSELNSMIEVTASCRAEAKYQNLRLVTMEPLIEPWSVKVTLSQQHTHVHDLDEREQLMVSPWKLDISSDVFFQLNLTDALIANLVAADRAWRWVVNAGGDSREMTEYSTYWIRNNTGMPLRYWGASYNEHSLSPGQEEPLRFNKDQSESDKRDDSKRRKESRRSTYVRDRHIFIAVEEEYPSDSLSNIPRKWQSEAPIPVDQVDSRMYALVDFEADITATRMRKCECVIDVLVERGCKYFVVRSTLILENQTSSDLEIEFVPPQRRLVSRSLRTGNTPQGHIIPIWKKVVKTSSVVPVPVHIVSSGEGYAMVRPPEINGADTGDGDLLPKAYAKERVHLPLFDRGSSSASENMTHMETDESGQAQCTIKFRRLYSDRPVRPFMMNVCLSSASSALYHRTLSFHPPLIVHNLTAGPLDFCLATPSDWSPAVEAVTLSNAGMNAGWETREQRLRERGTINVADSLIWHLSSELTPLELSVRMKGFDWSESIELEEDLGDVVRIKMKDLVSDAHLYITADIRMSKGHCRELFLYVPYWIVNLTGLKLEYEYEEERMGREHSTTLLAGQKRLDRDELLLKETQRTKAAQRDRNPHLLHPVPLENNEFTNGIEDLGITSGRSVSPNRRESERKRRHPRLLPSVPAVKGLLDLLPKTIEYDPRSLGQLEVLQACHSDYRTDRGCARLRVSNERDVAALDARKENGQRKWSDPFVLDQAGTIGEIESDDYGTNRKFSIGYSIIPAKGQYSRTKVIMLTPRFMLINTMSSAIEVCHSSSKMMTPSMIDIANASGSMPNSRVMSPVNPVVQLDAGAFADFHWTLRFAKTRTIRCRFAEYGWSWSGAVPLHESGEYAVRMRHESTRESKLVRVTLKQDSSCICVYFREERTTAPPYRVENYSLETLRTHQHRVRRSEILLPHHSLDYAWDEPTEERLLVVDMLPSAAGDNSRPLRIGSFDLDKIQKYPDALGGTLGIEISTDGPTRVLRFTDTRLRGEKAVPASTHVLNDQSAKTEASDGSALQLLQRFVTTPTVHAALHLQGVGISIVNSTPKELVYMSISGIALEVLVSEDDRNNSGASIAGSAASLSRLERETRPRILACCIEVNDVQIDNQLQMTPYPVLLRFSNPNGRSRIVNGQTVNIPVLQVGLVKHDEYAGIEFIRHFSVSVLPVHIRVDGALLYQILPLLVHAKIYGNSGNASAAAMKRAVVLVNGVSSSDEVTRAAHSHLLLNDFNASLEVPVKVLEAAQKDGNTSAGPTSGSVTPTMKTVTRRNSGQHQLISPRQNQHTALAAEIQRYTTAKYGSLGAIAAKDELKKLYFEEFHIDPIRATVSFSFGDSAGAIVDGHLSSLSHAAALTDSSSSRESSVITVGPLRLILNAIGTSLTKIANAPFQLKALHIHNSFVQPDALATRLASHYQSEALRQAYVILGSVDVLGNPMIAWKNLRSGFQDFISEPAHGLLQRSPQAFAFGVGRGSLSLVRASVYTFLDFNTRILTAFSLGLSEACLKLDDYTGYPATRHIFQGLVQGVSGVVVAPIHSFEVNGARGVIPGLIAGAFGVVLKPLLGFSLATATTAATLRDAVDPNTKALLVRVRPPRHIDLRTKRLKVYSYVESLGEEIVGKIRGGRYRADGYLGHVDLKATHQCFLVTRKRILFLNVKGTGSAQTTKYDVEWELLAEEVVMVDCSRTPNEQIVTIYYMEDEFRAASGAGRSTNAANGSSAVTTSRRRTPGVPRGMFLQKHEVALPDTKVLFVRAMLQQQERSLLTKMNSYSKDGKPHQLSPVSPLTRSNSMELSTAWQPQHPNVPLEYPIFRLPPSLHQARSFSHLAKASHNHQQQNQPAKD